MAQWMRRVDLKIRQFAESAKPINARIALAATAADAANLFYELDNWNLRRQRSEYSCSKPQQDTKRQCFFALKRTEAAASAPCAQISYW
jgi:hypothetical protein